MKTRFAIVDAYSSGNLLAPLLKERGIECVHVQSTETIPDCYAGSFIPEQFIDNIIHRGNTEKTIEDLKAAGVTQVIVGIESGVELADELSERMGCLSNGTKLSEARRDKYKMVKALEANGVRAIPSLLTNDLNEAFHWIGAEYPVVLKPQKSAGTDNVRICRNPSHVQEAFEDIYGQINQLGIVNDKVLLQRFIEGDEYIVDVVACDGEMIVSAIYAVKKKPNAGSMVYDRCILLTHDGEIQNQLKSYARKVIDALGISVGPAHLEIMIDKDGPVLIEVGARLDGCRAPILQRVTTEQDQAESTIHAFLERPKFEERTKHPYKVKRYMNRTMLISNVEGVFKGFRHLDKIKNLRSFHGFTQIAQVGQHLPQTSNLFNLPGMVDLVHEDKNVVHEDYNTLRELEKSLYIVEPETKQSAL